MTRQEFIESSRQFFIDNFDILKSKGSEYSSDDNPFLNFEQTVPMSFNNSREAILWGFMLKHITSIKDLVNNIETQSNDHNLTNNIIDEKIGDTINYLLLLRAMLKEHVIRFQ